MTQIIEVEINPFNTEWCGHCKQLLTRKFGSIFYCRLFSDGFDKRSISLDFSEENCVERHEDCKKLAREKDSE